MYKLILCGVGCGIAKLVINGRSLEPESLDPPLNGSVKTVWYICAQQSVLISCSRVIIRRMIGRLWYALIYHSVWQISTWGNFLTFQYLLYIKCCRVLNRPVTSTTPSQNSNLAWSNAWCLQYLKKYLFVFIDLALVDGYPFPKRWNWKNKYQHSAWT